MTVRHELMDALDLNSLKLPPDPKVLDVRIEDFVDHTGDDTLRLFLTIAEETDVDNISGQAVADLKHTIRERLRELGVTVFAYISMAKPSEWADTDDEEY